MKECFYSGPGLYCPSNASYQLLKFDNVKHFPHHSDSQPSEIVRMQAMRRARHSQRSDYVTMLSHREREAVKSFLRLL